MSEFEEDCEQFIRETEERNSYREYNSFTKYIERLPRKGSNFIITELSVKKVDLHYSAILKFQCSVPQMTYDFVNAVYEKIHNQGIVWDLKDIFHKYDVSSMEYRFQVVSAIVLMKKLDKLENIKARLPYGNPVIDEFYKSAWEIFNESIN
jgi:hypothetical protein